MSKVGYVINYAGYGTDVDKEWMKRFGCTEIMEEKQEWPVTCRMEQIA